MIVTDGGRRAALRTDEPTAVYAGSHCTRDERPASGTVDHTARVVVEVSRAFGGMTMRALIGAQFFPEPQGMVTGFEVPFGESMEFGAVTSCVSELGGPLVAGLPRDFVYATLDGLAGDVTAGGLPAGVLRVDRAGFDEIGSSEMAFKLAGDLLRRVMAAVLRAEDPLAAAQTAVSRW